MGKLFVIIKKARPQLAVGKGRGVYFIKSKPSEGLSLARLGSRKPQ